MKLPSDWARYKETVERRAHALASAGLWSVRNDDINRWLNNFQNEEYRYLALHILDSVIFRTSRMLVSGYTHFLNSEFRHYVRAHNPKAPSAIREWMAALAAQENKRPSWANNIIICPVKKENETTESGSRVARALTSDLVGQAWFGHLTRERGAKLENHLILLVDDFAGSGKQFVDFADSIQLKSICKKNRVIYAPLMAMSSGHAKIKADYPEVDFHPIELLEAAAGIFSGSPDAPFRNDSLNTVGDALACYNAIIKDYRLTCGDGLGYEQAGMSVAFEWGCPNQTLSVLHHEQKRPHPWNRLFCRRG